MKNDEMRYRHRLFFVGQVMALLGGCMVLAGCETLGALIHVVTGEEPVDAEYVLPKGKTLVMVEDYRSPDEEQLDGDQIAREVSDELNKSGKLDVVDPDKLVPLRENDAAKFRQMNIQTVGKTLGAKQVIYVDLIESEVSHDASAGAVHAVATGRVKVVDCETGNTLWPGDASHGKEISQSIEYDPAESTHAVSMHTDMLAKLSSKIAKLFYRWKPEGQDEEHTGG